MSTAPRLMGRKGEESDGRLIFLVDDDPGILRLMERVLVREGHRVLTATSGAETLKLFPKSGADLLVVDLKLTDAKGSDLVSRMEAESGDTIPFVVITGQGDERVAVSIMKQGALDYLMKDANLLEFLPSTVSRALGIADKERKLKAAQVALQRSDQHHRQVLRTALDGFIRFDLSGRILEVNEAMAEICGYTAEKMVGMMVGDFDVARTTEEIRRGIAQVQQQGFLRFDTRLRRRDGMIREVEVASHVDETAVFGFVHDVTEKRRLERAVIELSERERRSIGRDLHDGLGQQLTGLGMMAQTLVRRLEAESSRWVDQARGLARQIVNAITVTRQLSHGLSPVAMEQDGLMIALRELADSVTQATEVQCDFDCPEPVNFSDPSVATHLYRIAQEAVNNAVKHSRSERVKVRLWERAGRVELMVEDEGVGIPAAFRKGHGIGLEVMRYRARLMGAQLEIISEAKSGVRVRCTLGQSL